MTLHLFTIDETAEQLRVSRRWLQDFIKRWPFYKIAGRRKVFTPQDIILLHAKLPCLMALACHSDACRSACFSSRWNCR